MFRKEAVLGLCFVVLIAMAFFASAETSLGKVGYIFRNGVKIDEKITGMIEDRGYNVDFIDEKNLPIDFSAYDFIFVGDERFRNPGLIPVGEVDAVVINYYHGDDWGLTDRDGISQMGSSSQLKADCGQGEFEVYTQAFKRGRISLPYYYLDKENKKSEVERVCSAQKSGSGKDFGDVIAHLEDGAKTCFFGIRESEFWTEEAEELFEECVDYTAGGSVECFVDEDCPKDVFGEFICEGDEIYQVVTDYECGDGKCGGLTDFVFVNECEFGCYQGACLEDTTECETDSDCPEEFIGEPICENGDVYQLIINYGCEEEMCVMDEENVLLEDCDFGCSGGVCLENSGSSEVHDVRLVESFTNSVDGVKIIKDGDVILEEDLECGEDYKIYVSVENVGDFVETVLFEGSVGDVLFSHNPLSDFEISGLSTKYKTVNMNLEEGSYTIRVEAIIEGFDDANPTDNVVEREIFVECES